MCKSVCVFTHARTHTHSLVLLLYLHQCFNSACHIEMRCSHPKWSSLQDPPLPLLLLREPLPHCSKGVIRGQWAKRRSGDMVFIGAALVLKWSCGPTMSLHPKHLLGQSLYFFESPFAHIEE